MSRVSPLDYEKVIKALSKIGYAADHQKGSHIVMYLIDTGKYYSVFSKREPQKMVVVPAHKPIGRGMVRTIIREVALSAEEFWKLL